MNVGEKGQELALISKTILKMGPLKRFISLLIYCWKTEIRSANKKNTFVIAFTSANTNADVLINGVPVYLHFQL